MGWHFYTPDVDPGIGGGGAASSPHRYMSLTPIAIGG